MSVRDRVKECLEPWSHKRDAVLVLADEIERVEEKIDARCLASPFIPRYQAEIYTEGYVRQLQKQVEDQKVQLDYLREALHNSDVKYINLKNRVNNLAVEK